MLSIVLATYNEEKNIKRCLGNKAVKKIADEVIVVDGSSSDNTRELALKLGAKVIKTTNKKNFHINKQMAMNEAKGDLVLQLDADEVVDDELAQFITKLKQEIAQAKKQDKNWQKKWSETKAVAWYIKRRNLFLGHWLTKGGQYPDAVIRLYINGFAKLPQKDVHEQMTVNGIVKEADGHFLHYANPTFSDYLRKFNTYTSFKADQLLKQKVAINFSNAFKYFVFKPLQTFFLLYFRHRGYVDGVAGFIFAVMSGLHHSIAYLKLWEIKEKQDD